MKRFKSRLAVVAACAMLACSAAITIAPPSADHAVVYAAEIGTSGSCGDNANYVYNTSTGVLTITGKGEIRERAFYEVSNVTVTSIVIGEGITGIGQEAFVGTTATSIQFPSTLKTIGGCIIEGNTGIKSVTIPKSVVEARSNNRGYTGAFYGSAIETLVFQNGIKTVPAFACNGMKSLTKVTIPNSVKVIEEHAFDECTSLTSISIPSSVTEIQQETFVKSGLTSLTIPGSVTKLGGCILEFNTGVKSITIPKSVVEARSNNRGYTGALYGSAVETVVFENGIKTVPAYTCNGAKNLIKVTIPSSVKVIEEHAFEECTSLTSISIPSSVTEIQQETFVKSGLTSLTIPGSVTKLGGCILEFNTGVKSITIPKSVVEARSNNRGYTGALYGSAVETVVFENGIKTVPAYTCNGAKSLTKVTIPSSVKVIEEHAFEDCQSLTGISIPLSVTEIQQEAFVRAGLKSLKLPSKLKTIGGCILEENTGVYEITIPKTVETMGSNNRGYTGALRGSAVKNVIFEDGILSIPEYAVEGMERVTAVSLPTSVTEIREDAFKDSPSAVIYGYTGSYPITYAKANNIKYKSVGTAKKSKITTGTVKKVMSAKAQTFTIKTVGKGKVTYKSNNKSVKVDKNGKVTIAKKFIGQAEITVKVAAKEEYLYATKTIKVKVSAPTVKITSAKKSGKTTATVKWKKNTLVTGYEVQYSTNSKFKKNVDKVTVKKNKTTKTQLKSLKKGKTYYVRVRTYKKSGGTKYVSGWSAVKKVKM